MIRPITRGGKMSKSRRIDTALFGTLGIFSSSIFFSYSSLPTWSIYIVVPLIVIMWLVLLWISPLPELIKKRNDMKRRNDLAKKFFQKFKQKNFVDSFSKIHSKTSDGTYHEDTFHKIIDKLKKDHYQEFESLPESEIYLIRAHFSCWLNRYNYFHGKIDFNNFSTILKDFSIIAIGYHQTYVSRSLQKISRITEKNDIKIDEQIKKDWKTAMGHYDDFEKRYNHFVDEVNREFGETILSVLPPAKEL